jgi:hypothetical protein
MPLASRREILCGSARKHANPALGGFPAQTQWLAFFH